MKIKHKNFEKEIFPVILTELGKKNPHYTKSRDKPNWVKIHNDTVYVKTNRSHPKYNLIPHDYFARTWDILCRQGAVTQPQLSREENIKRSAFILIAFDLLEFVEYTNYDNALTINEI